MAEPSLQLGNGNWAGKSDNLLAYHKANNNFYADELTFARASTGTIVNADGLIEEVPYNLIRQSNQFDTTWTNSNTTETSGQSGYDGSNDAWLLDKSASSAYLQNSYVFNGSPYTFSTYLKSGSKEWSMLFMGGRTAFFNLSNGTKGFQNGTSSSIESIGNGWYRCSLVFNYNGSSSVRIYPADGDNDVTGTSGSIYIQDAQLNSGSTAKTYYPTTTRLNIPRVDYLNNANGSLLLEPQRTNFCTLSNDFYNWGGGSSYITSNYATSPDGTQNASRCLFTNSGQIISIATAATGTLAGSVYIKGIDGETIQLSAGGAEDLITLTGEWQRLVVIKTNINGQININTYGGATARDFIIYGAQLEQASYPTSYIPTSGTTVTRIQDASSTTGLSDLIGQTEGTLFLDFKKEYDGVETFSINDGSTLNRVYMGFNGTNFISQARSGGGASQASFTTPITNGTRYKCAFAYKLNDFALYINGVQIGTDTSGIVPVGMSILSSNASTISDAPFFSPINQAQLYKTRLTNTELATLTT